MKNNRPLRVRYSNHFKCLLCYLIVFLLPLLAQGMGLVWIYPYKLSGTAPDLGQTLPEVLPGLSPLLEGLQSRLSGLVPGLTSRELLWLLFLGSCGFAAWLLTLLIQLLWRLSHGKATFAARRVRRGVHSMRWMLLLLWLLNAAFAFGIWMLGLGFVPRKTPWDYLCCYPLYLLNPLCAWVVSRLAAPPVLSSRNGFFKRL